MICLGYRPFSRAIRKSAPKALTAAGTALLHMRPLRTQNSWQIVPARSVLSAAFWLNFSVRSYHPFSPRHSQKRAQSAFCRWHGSFAYALPQNAEWQANRAGTVCLVRRVLAELFGKKLSSVQPAPFAKARRRRFLPLARLFCKCAPLERGEPARFV